jgi:hypothetical protein
MIIWAMEDGNEAALDSFECPLFPQSSMYGFYEPSSQNYHGRKFSSIAYVQGFNNPEQIALASYIHPAAGSAYWSRLIDYPSEKVSVLVANVMNGPDNVVSREWTETIERAFRSRKRVIGYVRTGYLGVSVQKFQTRLGSTALADWAAQIQLDVDLWYRLYPRISGIFFDEGWNECGKNNIYSDFYKFINDQTKRKYPGAFTVLNPGDAMPSCFEDRFVTVQIFL